MFTYHYIILIKDLIRIRSRSKEDNTQQAEFIGNDSVFFVCFLLEGRKLENSGEISLIDINLAMFGFGVFFYYFQWCFKNKKTFAFLYK